MVSVWPLFRRLLYALLVMALLAVFGVTATLNANAALPAAPAAHVAQPGDYVPGEVIVKFKDSADPMGNSTAPTSIHAAQLHSRLVTSNDAAHTAMSGLLSRYHLHTEPKRQSQHLYTLRLDPAATGADMVQVANQFAANPMVDYAEPNYSYHIDRQPNDPSYLDGTQWSLKQINMPAAWDVSTGSPLITVAVIDTGVRPDHPDLKGTLVPGYNFAYNTGDTTDDEGHGTHVSGIIAANSNNGIGISGIAWAVKIMPIKVLNSDGGGNSIDLANGIRYAADHGARIINTSLGSPNPSRLVSDAVGYALGKGLVFISSSGNDGSTVPNYPAALPGVISVGASSPSDQRAFFSSYGPTLSVVAPGISIYSLSIVTDGDYSTESGTSFSSPITAGVAALMLSVNPQMTAVQVRDVLEGTADDIAPAGRDDKTGFGRVNAGRALASVKAGNLNPNHKSAIQGVVRNNPGDAYVTLTPGYNLNLNNGQFTFPDAGNAVYSVTATSPSKGVAVGPVTVQTTGQPGTTNIFFDFATGQSGIGQPSSPPTPTPPPTFPPTPTPPAVPLVATPLAQAKALFNPIPAFASTPTKLFFSETGHSLSEPFKTYWQSHGGLPVFGFPISEPFNETSQTDGKVYVVQYFERNRYEFHPEAPQPYQVLLGLLGTELTKGRNFAPAAPLNISAPYKFFPQTQHNLSGKFLAYWTANGGLPIFGYPISEVLTETSTTDGHVYQVQYFERNRFELHSENTPPYDVELGLLGRNLAIARGYIAK